MATLSGASAQKRVLCLAIVCTMIVPGMLGIIVGSAQPGNPVPNDMWDMVIDGTNPDPTKRYFNITEYTPSPVTGELGIYHMDGNVRVISGGILRIKNATLDFTQDTANHYKLTVESGSLLEMSNSTIMTDVRMLQPYAPFGMWVNNSRLKLSDYSVIAFPGRFDITNSPTWMNDSWITSLSPSLTPTDYEDPIWLTKFQYTPIISDSAFRSAFADYLSNQPFPDTLNDCPIVRSYSCNDMMISDSRVDNLYEEPGASNAVTTTIVPITPAKTGDTTGDAISDLTARDYTYYTILSPPGVMALNGFVTSGLPAWPVINAVLQVWYNSTNYVYSINAAQFDDPLNWSSNEGVINNTVFSIQENQPMDVYQEYNLFNQGIDTLAELSTLDITCQNCDDDVGVNDALLFDMIVISVTQLDPNPPTAFVVDNTELTIINTYIGADYLNPSYSGRDNKIVLSNGAHLYAYNMTVQYNEISGEDWLEVGALNVFQCSGTSVAYVYRLVDAPVWDVNNNPVENCYINATGDYLDNAARFYLWRANELQYGPNADNTSADRRIVAYLDAHSAKVLTGANYDYTDIRGTTTIPVLTDVVNASMYTSPNSQFVGNYKFKAAFNDAGTWRNVTRQRSFAAFPDMRAEKNVDELVDASGIPLLKLSTLSLGLPDLTVGTISFVPNNPNEMTTVAVSVNLQNNGSITALNFRVTAEDIFPGEPTELINETDIASLLAGNSILWTFPWVADPSGQHFIKITMDVDGTVNEGNETNNTNVAPNGIINVIPFQPELYIDTPDIWFDPTSGNLSFGDPMTIYATVHNNGTAWSNDTIVMVFHDDPDVDNNGVLDIDYLTKRIDVATIDIPYGVFGTSVTISVTYTPPIDDTYNFHVWVDPLQDPDNDELFDDVWNNHARSIDYIVIPKPNLVIVSSTDITFNDTTPMKNMPVIIRATVSNIGGADAVGPFTVAFYQDAVGTLIGTQTVNRIYATSTFIVNQTWTPTTPGFHTIIVVLDTTGVVLESNEADNQNSVQVVVYDSMMDLIVDDNDIVVINVPISVRGFVLVEDNGQLTINGNLNILQTQASQFTIRVRNNGRLTLNNANVLSNNLAMNMYVEDSSMTRLTNTNISSAIDIKVSGNANVTANLCKIDGNFDTLAGSNSRVWAYNTTFSKALDDIRGQSKFYLFAVSTSSIRTYDTAWANVSRWVTVNVYDGQPMPDAYPVVGATVTLTYALNNPILAPRLARTATTNGAGAASFWAMSDIINPTVYPSSFFVGNYILTATFIYAPFPAFTETTSMLLQAYPVMTTVANYPSTTVQLWDLLPDLDPPMWALPTTSPGRFETIHIWTGVRNNGATAAHNVLIRFMDMTVPRTEDRVAPVINPSAWYNTSVDWSFSTPGVHLIKVIVDPYDEIAEMDGTLNNVGWLNITVRSIADLAFPYVTDVYYSSAPWVVNHPVTVYATVHNLGDLQTRAGGFNVSFYYNWTGGTRTLIEKVYVPLSIQPGGWAVAQVVWTPDNTTIFNITAIADEPSVALPTGEVEESSETNNTATNTIEVVEYSDLYIPPGGVTFSRTSPVDNNTRLTIMASVLNVGGAPAEDVVVRFYDGNVDPDNLIGTDTILYLPPNLEGEASITWDATCHGRQTVHIITVEAVSDIYEDVPGQSNVRTANITVVDRRPDLQVFEEDVVLAPLELTAGQRFVLNVTVFNNGSNEARNVTIEVFGDNVVNASRLGNKTYRTFAGLSNKTVSVNCTAFASNGTKFILVVVDRELNANDTTVGKINEFIESNNNLNITVYVRLPTYQLAINAPLVGAEVEQGVDMFVDGTITNTVDGRPAPNRQVTVELWQEGGTSALETRVITSGSDGRFTGSLPIPPDTEGQYRIHADADGATIEVNFQVTPGPGPDMLWLYILIIIIIVVVAIVAFTAYTYYFGVGKMVECGSCGAFIPEGATRCPKCSAEFEVETAKCSVCSAWIPIDAKKCPECAAEFTTGDETEEGYEQKMRKQYDGTVAKFRTQAARTLGPRMTDDQFMNWWEGQPTFITFDEWLREEEEMRRTGSKPCPQCGTPNSVTGKICHKCGTVLKGEAPRGKMPKEAAAPAAKPAQVPPPATAPKETKKCPNCNMQVDVRERVCPVCGNDFERPRAAPAPQPAQVQPTPVHPPAQPAPQQQPGQQPGMQPRPVVKKVVKAPLPGQRVIVRRPGEPTTEEKKDGEQTQ
jgi:subtilase family serine protease